MNHIVAYITDSLQGLYPRQELQSLAMIVCKDLLGLDDIDIYLRKDIKLSDNQQCLLEQTVKRLKNHEPIQYIRGTVDFYRLSFHVEPGVLIPRPETEELVDLILKENSGPVRVLDIGTGSGCIAISLAKHLPDGQVDAWDVSDKALAVARGNAGRLGVSVNFAQVDVLGVENEDDKYHIIVSNPPYIAEKERGTMDKNVLDWEPDQALFVPDHDPLCFYRHIAQLGLNMLVSGGRLYFEINQAYGPETSELLNALNYKDVQLIKDLFGNNRMIIATR
ncbi:peptide chain release factor N(5)-glutamine methyltransferase [Bacteroides sp. 51]|uniref:peptide chain release factor N(5)-glutamine methyltransferase n=1 Tax=Bacteroides sp. 51 TaxID=2302938 RepID=UPI0013D1D84E|nr:peptide chain release factor N(5)-glutamine methyltransferase [Bacteroides sp. 51]NDV83922.1 peptide chain release factor N(5)-glutamine methyltransferase [Bacteroides sp. 51]